MQLESRRRYLKGTSVLLALAAVLSGQAQTVAPQSSAPPDGEVHLLDEFVVTTEIGTYAEESAGTATKTSTLLKDVPMSVSVMNHAFISDLRAERLSDVYQYVTGLSYNDTSVSSGFSIRGFASSSNVKNIQIDGLPGLASRFGTQPTANIERVEVLKGPAAILYGYMEPGGLVNIVTKKPQARARTEVYTSFKTYASDISGLGVDNGYSVLFDTTGPITADRKLRYRLIAEYEDVESFRNDRWSRNFYVMPSLMYAWSPHTHLTVGIEFLKEKRAADEGLVAPGNREDYVAAHNVVYQNKDDWERDDGLVFTAEFKHRFANEWNLTAAARQVDHSDEGRLLRNQSITLRTPVTDSVVTRRARDQYNERNYRYFDATVDGNIHTGKLRHRVLLGTTIGHEQNYFDQRSLQTGTLSALSVNVYNPVLGAAFPAPTPGTLRDTKIDTFGVYGQVHSDLTPRLKSLVAIRYDKQEIDFAQERPVRTATAESAGSVPSFGLVFQPTERISVYASYAESYHPILNSYDREDISGRSGHWDPETAHQMEAGLKMSFPSHGLTLSAAVYEIEKDNIMEQTGTPNVNGVNYWVVVGSVKSKGAEVEFQYRPKPHIQFLGGYAYTDAFVSKSLNLAERGAPARNVPHHTANLWARYNVPDGTFKGLGFGLGAVHQSERVGVTTNNPALQFRMSAYTKLDGAVYYRWRAHSLALNVKNLTDKRYLPGGGTGTLSGNVRIAVGEPRQVTLSFRTLF